VGQRGVLFSAARDKGSHARKDAKD